MSANYKVFMDQIMEATNDIIKENNVEDVLQVQSLQMMANGIWQCMKEALKNPQKGQTLDQQLIQPWKSARRLLDFCIEEASKRAIKNSKMPVMISSDMITEWIYTYYELDDKEKIEEMERKAEEARKAAEEAKRKKEEAAAKKKAKLEKDVKKAENLLEKNFALGYKFTEKDEKLFERLKKENRMGYQVDEETNTKRWFIKDIDENDTDETEEIDESMDEELTGDDEDIEFMDAE